MKSYIKEMAVMKKLTDYMSLKKAQNDSSAEGFPTLISSLEGQNQSEILMEALGPNLRKLLKESPNQHFSKMTIFMITI
jgi:hypothetical protein